MAKRFSLFLVLVVSAIAMMVAGCAKSNPSASADDEPIYGNDGGISIVALAKTAESTDTVDTIGVGVTVMLSANIARLTLKDSIIAAVWRFGDGTSYTCTDDSGVCSAEHQYNVVDSYTVELLVILKGNIPLSPWRTIQVVEESDLPSVVAQQDSLFVWLSSSRINATNFYDATFGIGVNAITAAALRAGVSVRPYKEGGSPGDWNLSPREVALVSKTSDGKFYVCQVLGIEAGKNYSIRIGIDLNAKRFLYFEEIVRNPFAIQSSGVFEFSLKFNGQCVPKTTDYGTAETPIDSTVVVPTDSTRPVLVGEIGDTSATEWIVRKEYIASRSSYIFYLNMNPATNPVGQVAQPPFVTANLNSLLDGGKVTLTMMPGDSIGYFELAVASFPADGLRLYQYGRGTAYRNFAGSQYALSDGSLWITANVADLAKRAVR